MLNFSLVALLCLIWGSTWLGIKIGLEDFPPFLSAGIRFVIASVVLFLIARVQKARFPKDLSTCFRICVTAIFMYVATYILVYWGAQYISSGLASVLFSTHPFFVALFAHSILSAERFTLAKGMGLLLGVAGILVIFSERLGLGSDLAFWGMVALIASAATSGYASVLVKRYLTELSPVVLTSMQMALAALIILSLGFLTEDMRAMRFTLSSVGSLLYLSLVGSALAFSLYYWLLQRMEATRLSLMAFVTPVVALFLGWATYGETINIGTILGTVLVFLGIYVVNYSSIRSRKLWNATGKRETEDRETGDTREFDHTAR